MAMQSNLRISVSGARSAVPQNIRYFTAGTASFKGLSPDSEDPRPKEAEPQAVVTEPTDISIEQYHEVSDAYIDKMVAVLEELQEERDDVDVEYSVRTCLNEKGSIIIC
jgi:frataxin